MDTLYFYILLEGVRLTGQTSNDRTDLKQYVVVSGHNGINSITGVHPNKKESAEGIAGRTYSQTAICAEGDDFWWNVPNDITSEWTMNHVIWREPIIEGKPHNVTFTWMAHNSGNIEEAEDLAKKILDQMPSVDVSNLSGFFDTNTFGTWSALPFNRADEFLGQFVVCCTLSSGDFFLDGAPSDKTRTELVELIGRPTGDLGDPGFRLLVGKKMDNDHNEQTSTTIFLRCFVQNS